MNKQLRHTRLGFNCRWLLTANNTFPRAPFAGARQFASPRVSHDVTGVVKARSNGCGSRSGIDTQNLFGIHQADAARAGGIVVLLQEFVFAVVIRDVLIARTGTRRHGIGLASRLEWILL